MANSKISEEEIDAIVAASNEKVWHPFPTITIVAWELPNGYVISDQSGCIDPENYDEELGVKYSREHLKTKVWQLEGYRRKQQFREGEWPDGE